MYTIFNISFNYYYYCMRYVDDDGFETQYFFMHFNGAQLSKYLLFTFLLQK